MKKERKATKMEYEEKLTNNLDDIKGRFWPRRIEEQETVIKVTRNCKAIIYTNDLNMLARLRRQATKYPDKFKLISIEYYRDVQTGWKFEAADGAQALKFKSK